MQTSGPSAHKLCLIILLIAVAALSGVRVFDVPAISHLLDSEPAHASVLDGATFYKPPTPTPTIACQGSGCPGFPSPTFTPFR